MKLVKHLFFLFIFLVITAFSDIIYALPFNIVAEAALPTTVPSGGIVTALYTVTNNTQSPRFGNFVKYLPPNVSQVTNDPAYCGATFNLAGAGQPGSSCILNLTINGPVDASDPNPHNHLFVCFSGGATCAGTPNPLNVTVLPITLYGTTGNAGTNTTNALYTIDPNSGHATYVMQLTNDNGAVISSDGLNLYHWVGFNPVTTFERVNLSNNSLTNIPYQGNFISEVFGAVFYKNAFLVADTTSKFFSFNITGSVAQIGSSGFNTLLRGMACLHNRVYAVERDRPVILEVNRENGHILSSTPIIFPGFTITASLGLTVNPSTGQFYALFNVQGSIVRKLAKLDIGTGLATLIGNIDDGTGLRFASIAFHPADPNCN